MYYVTLSFIIIDGFIYVHFHTENYIDVHKFDWTPVRLLFAELFVPDHKQEIILINTRNAWPSSIAINC